MPHLKALLGLTPGNPLRVFMIGYLAFLALDALAVLVLYLIGVDFVYPLVGLTFLMGAVVVIPIIVLFNRPIARDMRRLMAGEHWARWSYTSDEWRRFAEAECMRARRTARREPLYALLFAAVIGVAGGVGFESVFVGVLTGGIVLAVGMLIALTTYLYGRYRYARRDRMTGEVVIGPRGVWHAGAYTPIDAFNLKLATATVEAGDPATLLLVTESWTQHGNKRSVETRVPVPCGREDEARELAQRLLGHAEAT